MVYLLWLLLVCLCASACEVETRGYYDATSLQYSNVVWEASTAPDRHVEMTATLFKLRPDSPLEINFDAFSVGGKTTWRANATLVLYASSSCDRHSTIEERSDGVVSSASHIHFNFTSHLSVACSSQYYMEVTVAWDRSVLRLAVNDTQCFQRNVCCLSAGHCNTSPHSICAKGSECLASGHSINDTVSCDTDGQVCCMLGVSTPSLVPLSNRTKEAIPDDDVFAYILIYMLGAIAGITTIGGCFYYHKRRYGDDDATGSFDMTRL